MDELKLSLEEEIEKQALKIEDEIMNDKKLEDIQVSDQKEAELLARIRVYEKKRERRTENIVEVH